MSIKVNDLDKALIQEMNEYYGLVGEELKKAVKGAAKKTVKELRSTSPVKTGSYSKGWTVKQTEEKANRVMLVVHNKTDYQLTHLLENGHAKQNGGRTRKFPHIGKAESNSIDYLEQEIKRRLSR